MPCRLVRQRSERERPRLGVRPEHRVRRRLEQVVDDPRKTLPHRPGERLSTRPGLGTPRPPPREDADEPEHDADNPETEEQQLHVVGRRIREHEHEPRDKRDDPEDRADGRRRTPAAHTS